MSSVPVPKVLATRLRVLHSGHKPRDARALMYLAGSQRSKLHLSQRTITEAQPCRILYLYFPTLSRPIRGRPPHFLPLEASLGAFFVALLSHHLLSRRLISFSFSKQTAFFLFPNDTPKSNKENTLQKPQNTQREKNNSHV